LRRSGRRSRIGAGLRSRSVCGLGQRSGMSPGAQPKHAGRRHLVVLRCRA
jgi:hypothetical protein